MFHQSRVVFYFGKGVVRIFTGIVEEVATIQSIRQANENMVLQIQAEKILQDAKLGDSIAVNGVCLTIEKLEQHAFHATVMKETFHTTTLHRLQLREKVNVERALQLQGRLGGHIVTGHVETVGKIQRILKTSNEIRLTIETEPKFIKQMVPRGSVTVDGISLTIFALNARTFEVSLIPHTYETTILHMKKVRDVVNIETDYIGKYVQSQMATILTEDFLRKNGF